MSGYVEVGRVVRVDGVTYMYGATAPEESRRAAVDEAHVRLRVLGKVELLSEGRPVAVGTSCRRLLALLALSERRSNRVKAAGLLWPEVTGTRAYANLRSVLWRLQRSCCGAVEASFSDIWLSSGLAVDIETVSEVARRLLDRSASMDTGQLTQAMRCNFREDIAPDLNDDEWLEVERERYRQLRLHAMEALAEQLISVGWHGAAVDTALCAIHADPFRESAHQILVRAHLSEGNQIEARRGYARYRNLLRKELGLEPSDQFMNLLNGTARPVLAQQARHPRR